MPDRKNDKLSDEDQKSFDEIMSNHTLPEDGPVAKIFVWLCIGVVVVALLASITGNKSIIEENINIIALIFGFSVLVFTMQALPHGYITWYFMRKKIRIYRKEKPLFFFSLFMFYLMASALIIYVGFKAS